MNHSLQQQVCVIVGRQSQSESESFSYQRGGGLQQQQQQRRRRSGRSISQQQTTMILQRRRQRNRKFNNDCSSIIICLLIFSISTMTLLSRNCYGFTTIFSNSNSISNLISKRGTGTVQQFLPAASGVLSKPIRPRISVLPDDSRTTFQRPRNLPTLYLQMNVNGKDYSNGQEYNNNNNNTKTTNNDNLSSSQSPVVVVNHHPNTTTTSMIDIPKHVAFVCDGNSRWAKRKNIPTVFGHAEGAKRLVEIISSLKEYGVSYCTMYGFSTENWKRSTTEINDILSVMEQTARQFYSRAMKEQVRIQILGNIDDERLPISLRDILKQLEQDTKEFGIQSAKSTSTTTTTTTTSTTTGDQLQSLPLPSSFSSSSSSSPQLTICLAVNYGGRQDIVNASLKLAKALSNGEIVPDDVNEDMFASYMYTSNIPDPDLIIRTSGECRLSNFLLWNSAYSEIYFTPVLWPDFNDDHWRDAVTWYGERKRRFGGRDRDYDSSKKEQLHTTTPKRRVSVSEP